MATYKQFEELPIWNQAKNLAVCIYKATRNEGMKRDFGFVDQIRRAAVSVSSNIAEGFETDSSKEMIRYLNIAKGSAGEVRSLLYIAKELDYISEDELNSIVQEVVSLSRQIHGFREYLRESIESKSNVNKEK